MGEKSQRKGHLSENQKRTLINIMEEEHDLRKGKFNPSFTFKDAQKKWEEIGNLLNSIPGAEKDWKEWRRTWQDLKKNIKKKTTDLKKYSQGTGGGPPVEVVLTDNDENLLKIMDTTTITGDPLIDESVVVIDDFDHNYAVTEDLEGDANLGDRTDIKIDPMMSVQSCSQSSSNDEIIKRPLRENNGTKKKRNVAVHRLQESVKAQENFTKIMEKKLELKTNYYKEKLEIMRADVKAKERIASALELMLRKPDV